MRWMVFYRAETTGTTWHTEHQIQFVEQALMFDEPADPATRCFLNRHDEPHATISIRGCSVADEFTEKIEYWRSDDDRGYLASDRQVPRADSDGGGLLVARIS